MTTRPGSPRGPIDTQFPDHHDPQGATKLRRFLTGLRAPEPLTNHEFLQLLDDEVMAVVAAPETIVSFGIAPLHRSMDQRSVVCLVRYDFVRDGTCYQVPSQGAATHHRDWRTGFRNLLKSAGDICAELAQFYQRTATAFEILHEGADGKVIPLKGWRTS